jgi:hypothetical protein
MEARDITREDYEFRREVLERLTRLETLLVPLNGGRLTSIENDIKDLKSSQSYLNGKIVGIATAIGTVIAFFQWVIFRFGPK